MPTKVDPQRIYIQAERFLYCDERLRSPANMSTPLAGAYIALPSIVLSAFASELYLKCLLCLEGFDEPPRSHSLWKLFKRLRRDTKEKLCTLWLEGSPALAPAMEIFKKEHNFEPAGDLATALRHGADSFEQLRYGYEDVPTTKFFLGVLPRILRTVVLERKPEWTRLGPAVGPLPEIFPE